MNTYAVHLDKPNDEAWNAIRMEWPNRSFFLTDHLAFVAPEGITTTAEMAETVGTGGERQVSGIVFDRTSHNGFNRGDLRERLQNTQS